MEINSHMKQALQCAAAGNVLWLCFSCWIFKCPCKHFMDNFIEYLYRRASNRGHQSIKDSATATTDDISATRAEGDAERKEKAQWSQEQKYNSQPKSKQEGGNFS